MTIPINRIVGLLVLLTASSIAAQTLPRPIAPTDFAWQWPVETGGTDGAVRFTLTPEVYARVTQFDLGDLAAFNAADESIPTGPIEMAFAQLVEPPGALPPPIEVPVFRVPAPEAAASGDSIALHIARGDDGRLTRLDAEVTPGTGLAASRDLLLDLSTVDAPVTALELVFEDEVNDLNTRVEVAGSDDLATWHTLATQLAVVSLRENSMVLERRRLEIPSTELPYLRLRNLTDAALPIASVRAVPIHRWKTADALPQTRQTFTLEGRALSDAPGSFDYVTAGPFPVERIAIELADRNAISRFVLASRRTDSEPWVEHARGTAFRLGDANAVSAAPVDLAITRSRHWRLRTEPPQTRAPTLTLEYRPEQFVLLTQGAAPYRLVAGSREGRRPDYPLLTVVAQLQAERGDLWLPPEATLGAGSPLSGDAALTAPPPPPPYKQWLLWGVLIAGALVVIAMVVKLMRAPPPASDA